MKEKFNLIGWLGKACSHEKPRTTVGVMSRINRYLTGICPVLTMTLILLFTMGIGEVWGTDKTYTVTNPTTDVNSSGPITIQGEYASSKKVDNSNQKTYITANGPLYIFSKAPNIKSVTLTFAYTGNGSGTYAAINVGVMSGAAFTTTSSVSGVSATLDENSVGLTSIAVNNNNTSHQTLVVTCSTAQSAVSFTKATGSIVIKSVSVVYDDAITAPDEFSEGHFTSTTAGSATNGCSWGSFTLNSTTATVGTKTYYKRNDNTAISYNLAPCEKLAEGDVILLDITGSGAAKTISMTLTNGPTWSQKTATQTAHNFIYVIPSGSALINATSFSFTINNTDTYVYGVKVFHAAAAKKNRIYMKCGSTWCDNVEGNAPKFFAYSWDATTNTKSTAMQHPSPCETDVYYVDIPECHTKVIFTRQKAASTELVWSGDNFVNQSQDITISTNDLFTCTGWSDGKGTFSGGTYSPSGSTYTVTYNGNGSDGGSVPTDSNSPYDCGDDVTVLGNTGSLTKAGYSFKEWNTAAGGGGDSYSAGDTYDDIADDVTLYAQWTQEIPTSASVSGTKHYFPGQTISLTVGTTGGATSGFTYQWQKNKSGVWTNLANGTDAKDGGTFSGVTSDNLQISGCTKSNSGSYRCVVSKLGASINSSEHDVHIYTIEGDYSGGSSWTAYDLSTTGTKSFTLNASSVFEFGIKDNYDNGWYKGNYILDDWTNVACYKGEGNTRLFTGPEGTYTFTIGLSHVTDNTPYVQISLSYPEVTHPAEGYTYFELPDGWTNVYLYWYTSDGYRLSDWSGTPELTKTATICGTTYYYSPLGTTYSYVIYKGNGSNQWPGDGYSTSGCSGKHMDETDYYSPAWAAFETYTITFAANGGSGTMSAINGICPDDDQALTANAYTKTGHTFANWTANVDVKVGGETVSAGSAIANQATIQNINSDITLTAQWTAETYDIIYMDGESAFAGDHESGYPTTHTYGTETTLKSATKTGYTLEGWYTEAELENKVTSLGATAYTDDITLYAKWTANEYSLTYMDGESAFAGTHEDGYPTTHTYGTATALKSATKTGYTLEGWYTEVGLENKVTSLGATAYTDDITLYAKWTANSYTLTLDDNGGSADGSGTVQTLGTSFSPSAPTYSGYTVEGYYTSANCTTKVATAAGALQASITVSEVAWTNSSSQWTKNGDATFYAKWKANTPTITCSKNKVTITGPTGATIYYTTDGSTTPTSSSTEYTGAFDIDETITVKAIAITSGDEFVDSDVASEECEVATLVTASWPMIANDTVTLNGSATTSVLTTSRVVKAGMGDITTALSVSYTDYTEKMAQVPTIGTVGTKGAVTDTSYVKYTITVAYGYTFTPTGFSAIVGRIGTDNGYAQAVLKTGSTTIKSSTASNPSRSGKSAAKTVYSASFDDASTYSAGTTIDLYIYFGGAMASGKSYVVSEVSITGEYAEVQIVPSFTSPASDPDDVEYTVGDLIEQLEVVATGSPTPTLQWYKNTANSTSSPTPVAITDSTNATFTPSNASASDLYYFCRATNSAGSADSRIFHVTVNAAPTYDATYDENGHGTAPDDEEEVTDVTLPQIDAVSGWRHTAWTADQDVKIGGVTIDAGETLAIGATAYLTDNTKFTAVWTATYAVAEGTHSNGSISISPTVGIAGETIEIEATANDDYLFDEWQIVKTSDATDVTTTLLGDNKSKASTSFTLPAYGVTINATFVEIEYCATMAINTSSTGALAVDNAVPTTGTATAKVVGVGDASSLYVDGYGLSFTKTGDKIEVTLPNVMVEGSIICIELYNGAANAGRGLTIQATDNSSIADIVYDFLEGGAKKLYYTVKSTDTKLIGKNQFRITRYSNVRLKSVSVGECGGKYIEPVLTYDNTTLYTDGTPSSASATLTGNKGEGTVTYSVSPTGVVSINASTGAITAVAIGSATVTASVAAANGYISATATCDIIVKGCGYQVIAGVTLTGTTTGSPQGSLIASSSGYGVNTQKWESPSEGCGTGGKLGGAGNYVYLTLKDDYYFASGDSVIVDIAKVPDIGDSKLHVYTGTTSAGTEIGTVETPVCGKNKLVLSSVPASTSSITIERKDGDADHKQNPYIISFIVKRASCSEGMIKPMPGISEANWGDDSSWIGGVAPTIDDHVVITNNMTVNTTTAVAKEIEMTDGATLTISAGKALIVANSITKNGSATAVGDIKLSSTSEAGTAALVMGDYNGTNEAEVEFYTKAGKNAKGEWVNQFIGTPYNDEDYVKTNFYGAQIYEFRAAQDGTYPSGNDNYWTRLSDDGDMAPFMGYNLLSTQTAGTITLDMNGKLVRTDQKVEKTMYYNGSSKTENMFANSWVAPIHIPAFETTDFGGGEATIYIFNAGTPEDAEDYEMGDGSADNNSPGQYIVLPIASSTWLSSTTVTVIPAMQAFSVFATDENQTLSLDYNKLVYEPALDSVEASKGIGVIPTRAKKNEVAPEVVKLHVSAVSGYAANAFVLGREDFTDGFDNGWDGRYMEGNEEAPQLYSLSADGDMTVNCVPEIEGTVLGFKAGSLDQAYTMSFEYNGEEELYLKDLYKNKYIESGETYWFTTDEDDVSPHNRFILTRYRSPQVATDLEPTPDPSLKGRENGFKFVEDQKIYILYRGVLYDATGKRVEERRNQK